MHHDPALLRRLFESFDYSPAPESPDKALAWLNGGMRNFGHFIYGEFTKPGNTLFDAVNPHNGQVLGHFTQGTEADVHAAMEAAQAAYPAWSALPNHKRAAYLYALEREILKHRRDLEVLESLNTGKPFRETRLMDIPLTTRHFGHHAALAAIFSKRFTDRQHLGVVGCVIPWNFPLLMAAWKLGPNMAVGNTVVIKAGDTTPVTIMYLAEIIQRIGLPPGVVNIVTGNRETGKLIVSHPIPKKIMFTGSTRGGREIRLATVGSGKQLSLELGGKGPIVVCSDADIYSAAQIVVRGILSNKGEICCATSKGLFQESIAPALIEEIKYCFSRIRIGDPLDKNTDLGPVNSQAQFDKITGMIMLAQEHGGTVWQALCPIPATGYYIRPTVLFVHPDNPVAREEIFGPVMVVMTFRTTDEAIALANNNKYGLSCTVVSRDNGKALYIASRINAGTRWVNCTQVFDAAAGFGGTRQSGHGREGGFEGIYAVTKEIDDPSSATPEPSLEDSDDAQAMAMIKSLMPDGLNQTERFLVGGSLARPDGARSFSITSPDGMHLGDVGDANRKDVRNAVKAAFGAKGKWAQAGGDMRRKVLMFLAEKMQKRAFELAVGIKRQTGCTLQQAMAEVTLSIERLFYWASWATNYGGTVQTVAQTDMQVVATNEPIGVISILCPDNHPLLGLINTLGPALAMGNTVVAIAGKYALTAMTLVEILLGKDVPDGVINILTSADPDARAVNLAKHSAVDAVWCYGKPETVAEVEKVSVCNMKRTDAQDGSTVDWLGSNGTSMDWLRKATQVMNTWTLIGA